MPKRTGNTSGWYTSENGQTFHAYGGDMSDETIAALGRVAEAAAKMLDKQCPVCGGGYNDPLHYTKERGWYCDCGWIGGDDAQ